MVEENISQELRLKNIDEIRIYLIKEINQNELISKKYKKIYRVWNYIEHLLTLVSTVTGFVYISAFGSLIGIPTGITKSARGYKMCVIFKN